MGLLSAHKLSRASDHAASFEVVWTVGPRTTYPVFNRQYNCSSINNMGVPVQSLSELAEVIWTEALDRKLIISCKHIRGVTNKRADLLSRLSTQYEWKLNPYLFKAIDQLWESHTIDRFAAFSATQLQRYNSRFVDPNTLGTDALAQTNWNTEINYVNPTFCLLETNQTVLQQHPRTSHINKFMVAFKRPQNLRDMLVHSSMKAPLKPGTFKCKKPKCTGCRHIDECTHFYDRHSGTKYPVQGHIDCNSYNVIYLLTCKKCQLQYIGQTSNPLKTRIYQHIRDIRAKAKTSVATHFRLDRHTENDVRACAIGKAPIMTSERLLVERAWITILRTTSPGGLNVQI